MDLLDKKVKMTGLTLNCGKRAQEVHCARAEHDVRLDVIMKSGAVHDCLMRT